MSLPLKTLEPEPAVTLTTQEDKGTTETPEVAHDPTPVARDEQFDVRLIGEDRTKPKPEEKVEVKEEAKPEVKAEPKEELPTEDQAKVVEKPEPREKDIFSKKFAALSRRERYLSQKEKAQREREKELEQLKSFKSKFEEDPYKFLEGEGITLESWSKHVLNDGKPDDNLEIKKIKRELEDIKAKEKEKQVAQSQDRKTQTYVNELNKIGSFLDNNEENYPLTKLFGGPDLVFDVRAENFAKDAEAYGQEYAMENMLSNEDAVEMTEKYLEENMKTEDVKKTLGYFKKKMDGWFASQEVEPTKEEVKEEEKRAMKEATKEVEKEKTPIVGKTGLPEKTQRLLGLKTLTNQQQTTVPVREDKKFPSEVDQINYIAEKFL